MKPGYKQTELGPIPEDWQSSKTGDICDWIVPGRNKPKLFDGDIPWITTPDLESGKPVCNSKLGLCISRLEAKSVGSKIVPPKSILMSCAGELGIVALAQNEIVVNQQLHVFIPTHQVTSQFLLFSLEYQKERIANYGTKTAVPYLNKDACNSIHIPLPSLPEQRAIATVLSDMDSLLDGLDRLIAKKRDIKQATMQQLLTGKTRLPGFEEKKGYKQTEIGKIPEDWNLLKISDVISSPMQNGLFFEPIRKGRGIPLVNVGDMYKAAPILIEELDLFDANPSEAQTFKVNEGDIFFTRSSIVPSGIAYCNILIECKNKNIVFDSHLIKARANLAIINPKYLYLSCISAYARGFLISSAKTATMTTIDQGNIKICPILVPSIEEQAAIAGVLADMDAEMAALEQRRRKTRDIKQAMMQELLTGRTRLLAVNSAETQPVSTTG